MSTIIFPFEYGGNDFGNFDFFGRKKPKPPVPTVDCRSYGDGCKNCCDQQFKGQERKQCKQNCKAAIPVPEPPKGTIPPVGCLAIQCLTSPCNCPGGYKDVNGFCCPDSGGGWGGGTPGPQPPSGGTGTYADCIATGGVGSCIHCCRRNYSGRAKKQCVYSCNQYNWSGGGGTGGGGSTSQCDSDSDCGVGKICQNGQCVTPTQQEIPQGVQCTTGTGGVQCHPIDYTEWGWPYPVQGGVVNTSSGRTQTVGDIVAEQEAAEAADDGSIVDWVQENPLTAAAVAAGIWYVFFKKKRSSQRTTI